MQREVTDQEGIRWVCAQAYAGITESEEKKNLAQVEGEENLFEVVCTPSGAMQTVRLELKGEWENNYSDEELLREIKARQEAA